MLLTEWIPWVIHHFDVDDSVHGLEPARHLQLYVIFWQGKPLTEDDLVGTDFLLLDLVAVEVIDIFAHTLASWDVGSPLPHSFVHTENRRWHNGAVGGRRWKRKEKQNAIHCKNKLSFTASNAVTHSCSFEGSPRVRWDPVSVKTIVLVCSMCAVSPNIQKAVCYSADFRGKPWSEAWITWLFLSLPKAEGKLRAIAFRFTWT